MTTRALISALALILSLGMASSGVAAPVLPPATEVSAAPVAAAPAALTGPELGEPAPAFALPTIDGKRVTLADFKGKTLVINVWGTWCPPCRQEMPDLLKTAPALMKSGVAFLGVDTTEKAPVVRAYAVAKAVPYPLAIDDDKSFEKAYDIAYFPTTFVIDPQGVLRSRYIDVLGVKQLTAMVDAARAGRTADIVSPLQSKIDAELAAAPHAYGSDPAAIEADAKTANKAIAAAEDDLDQSDAASGNSTDLLRTRVEQADLRDAAISALAGAGASIADTSLLPLLRGDAAVAREAWSEALSEYTAVLAVAPKNDGALAGVAQAAGRLEKYDVVVDADARLSALDPTDPAALVDLARAQAKAGHNEVAATTFARAIVVARTNIAASPKKLKLYRLLAYAHLYAGRFESANGDAAHARVAFRQALAAAEHLPASDARHDMYVEESQEADVALGLSGTAGPSVSLVPWTGADLPGSIPGTIKYRLVVSAAPGHNVSLKANDVPSKWVASFCSDRVCAPFRVSVLIPEAGVKVVEFQLIPPGAKVAAPRVRVTGTDGGREFTATT